MDLNIAITEKDLSRPGVPEAVSLLVAALTGAKVTPVTAPRASAPARVAAPAPRAAAAPAASKKKASAKTTAPAKTRKAPAKTPAPKKVIGPGAPGYADKWAIFAAARPASQRSFLSHIETNGEATLSEVANALGVAGKALGGIVGSLNRWARQGGLAVPFEAGKKNGERIWTWRA